MPEPHVAFTEILGGVIRERRKLLRKRQEDLAPILSIGPSAWSRLEAGQSNMTVVQLRATARALRTEASQLLRQAEVLAAQIPSASPGVKVVDSRPRSAAETAGWFLGGAAVGALVASLLSRSETEDDID